MNTQHYQKISALRSVIGVSVLLFLLLPMFDFKCAKFFGGHSKIATIKGSDLLIGTKLTVDKELKQDAEKANNLFSKKETQEDKRLTQQLKVKPHFLIVTFVALIVIAFVIGFVRNVEHNLAASIIYILAALCIISMPFLIKKHLYTKELTSIDNINLSEVKMDLAAGFHLCWLVPIIATVLSFYLWKMDKYLQVKSKNLINYLEVFDEENPII